MDSIDPEAQPLWRSVWRPVRTSALMGAVLGLFILGAGGRALMRVIAHWEGRVPAFTVGGTLTVVFAGMMAGLAGGGVHGILKRFVANAIVRNTVFLLICVAITWRAVNVLLPRPRLMFVALTAVYVIALGLLSSRRERQG